MTAQTDQAALAKVAEQLTLASFFYPHGIWAPGVKFMRRVAFSSKALIISLIFLVPLAAVVWLYTSSQQQQIDATRLKLEGSNAMKQMVPVIQGLLDTRNATRASLGGFDAQKEYQSGRAEVDQALKSLESHLQQTGDPLMLNAEFGKLKAAWANTASSRSGADDKGRTVFGPVTASLFALLQDVADNSTLVLDSNLDSFYLMNALVMTMPKLAENVGQLWGWATYAAAKDGLDPIQATSYAVWNAGALEGIDTAQAHFKRAVKVNLALEAELDLKGLDSASEFRKKVSNPDELIGTRPPKDVFAAGSKALLETMAVYGSGLKALDGLLTQRLKVLEAHRNFTFALLGVSAALGFYLFYSFFLVTRGGLNLMSVHLQEMASGDLRRAPSQPWGKDEPALLIHDLRKAYDALRFLIMQVRHSAHELNHAASEIAGASVQLSGRTEAAAANLEQQAAVMEEIGSTVALTAKQAQSASALAQNNAVVAERGGKIIGQAVVVMEEINTSSHKISDITGVIDGIAFQTNILALNAAVEAAHAGESGRGFAVVAAEVRALAQRSASAAKEIKTLITTSVEKVASGKTIVESAGSTMDELLANARHLSTAFNGIANGASEQATGVEQAAQAIQKLDDDTQQNAALVEQTSATAQALKDQADSLINELAKFQLPVH
jgi:methyl-accepting chemotaxis protein